MSLKIQFFLLILVGTIFFTGCNEEDPLSIGVPHPLGPFVSQNIYIVGASTVRYDNGMPGDIGAAHAQYSTRVAWGDELYNYLNNPENISNQARRGATAESYQTPNPDKGPGHWARRYTRTFSPVHA